MANQGEQIKNFETNLGKFRFTIFGFRIPHCGKRKSEINLFRPKTYPSSASCFSQCGKRKADANKNCENKKSKFVFPHSSL